MFEKLKKFLHLKPKNELGLTRKVKHGARIVKDESELKINHYASKDGLAMSNIALEKMVLQLTPNELDTIRVAKDHLLSPMNITEQHKEHILQACGFTKTALVNGRKEYDPRLFHIVNYSMNMYLTEMSSEIDRLTKMLENK